MLLLKAQIYICEKILSRDNIQLRDIFVKNVSREAAIFPSWTVYTQDMFESLFALEVSRFLLALQKMHATPVPRCHLR